jgi:hypothetical protein
MTEKTSPLTDDAESNPTDSGIELNVVADPVEAVASAAAEPGAPAKPGAPAEPGAQQLLPLSGGIRAVSKIFSLNWWNAAVVAVWEFRKYTLKPALIIAVTTFAYVGTLSWIVTTFSKHGDQPWMANEFLTAAFIAIPLLLGTVVVTLVGVTWSTALWFIILTAFCRSFLSIDPVSASRAELIESQRQASDHFKVNKRLILSTWLVYSILMTLPGMWLLIDFIVYMIASYPSPTNTGPPPAQLIIFCLVSGAIASVLLANHAFLLFAYSGVSKKGGRAVAVDSLKAMVFTFPMITIVSSISLAVAAVVIGVVGLLVFGQPKLVNFDGLMWLWILVLSAWHGVSSMVVLPLLMVVPCEMVRGSIE